MPPNILQPVSTISPIAPDRLKAVPAVKIDWPTPAMDSTRYLLAEYPRQAAAHHQDRYFF